MTTTICDEIVVGKKGIKAGCESLFFCQNRIPSIDNLT